MKLARIGRRGHEKPALMDADGRWRDLSAALPDLLPASLSPEGLARLRALDARTLPELAPQRFGVPWSGCAKVVCVGLNYSDHAAEAGVPVPSEPVLFSKPTSCLVGANDPVVLPQGSRKGDWEIELGFVIGSKARYVDEADALAHVAGYCIANDVSEREYQLEKPGGQWDKGKGCDTFGPVGPWLVTADEVPDPQALAMELTVNGERMQHGSTATMVFGVARLVAYISRFMTLWPGDLVITGTPPGVALGMKPPRWLKPGDEMRLSIAGLGEQCQRVHAWDPALIDG